MRAVCRCVTVLLFSAVLCVDFEGGERLGRGSRATFVKSRTRSSTPGVRPGSDPLPVGPGRVKRSEGSAADSCGSLRGYESRLKDNTHTYTFNDLSGSVSLAWVGNGTGVLLVLTTFQVPLFMIRFGQSKLYRSEDYGKSFQDVTDLINNTFIQSEFGIAIGPENSGKVILTGDVSDGKASRIFRSMDFGKSFYPSDLPFQPIIVRWKNGQNIVFNGTSVLKRLSLLSQNIHSKIWGVWSLFAGVLLATSRVFSYLRHMYIDSIFYRVYLSADSGMGTIYVSDDRGTVFSKSLERHLYTSTGGDTDFTIVSSLRGVYMTSVLAQDGSVQTVVTFDQGGKWRPLRKPWNGKCDATAGDPGLCSLHIHASYSTSMMLNVPMLPLTEPNAVGLILAHGSVGDAVSVLSPDVFVSDDGGYTWSQALKGPHHYAILDSGGLLVAVEHNPNQPIFQIKFSTDEGQCWHVYNFTDEPIYFTGLASEPGARSMNLSLWGYRESMMSQYWVSVTIDFKQLFSRDCGEGDYVQWLAHSDNTSDPTDGCLLGFKEKYLRLRKDSVCWNGRDYVISKQPTQCPCTLDDFQCDFGYYRAENSSECVEQPDLKGHTLEFCLHGRKEQLQTSGYRKIPGDRCEGGKVPERRVIDLSKKCVSNLLRPELLSEAHSGSSAAVIAVVIIVLMISAVAGVLLVKKYVCGGRFLVHRYSEMQRHVEANGIEGVDDLDTTEAGKTHYNDDSDEVSRTKRLGQFLGPVVGLGCDVF
uniref:Sortilin 1a n=1 Tax=Astyanax mexicanus TaxID=7994 RepID=A0A8B9J6J4_ASTMX